MCFTLVAKSRIWRRRFCAGNGVERHHLPQATRRVAVATASNLSFVVSGETAWSQCGNLTEDQAPKGASKGQLVSSPSFCQSPAMEIVFSITQEADGGFVGECLSHDIFTQGDTWDALRANVKEAVDAYFFDQPKPASIRLLLVRDEVLAA